MSFVLCVGRRATTWVVLKLALLALTLTASPAFAQSTPTEVVPGTWAVEPYWPALGSLTPAQLQSALGDFLDSADTSLNDPERLNIERALTLTIYFQDRAPGLPCAAILDEWQQLALPQEDIDEVAPTVQAAAGCDVDGVVDPDDESERPIRSPFEQPGRWCEDVDGDGNCDQWWTFWGEKPKEPPGCSWVCVAFTTSENGEENTCLRYELTDNETGAPCSNPYLDDTIDPFVSGSDDGGDGSGGGSGGAAGGGDGDDGMGGGGGPGGGGDSGSTDGQVAEGATGQESQEADLERQASGTKTCNPVLVSDGFKVEKDVDLVVPLVGRDFKLYRTYNGSHLLRNELFPWAMGAGWGTSADAWIVFWPGGPWGGQSCLGDRIDLTIFPLEHSTQYLDPNLGDGAAPPEYLTPLGVGSSRFRRSTRNIDGLTANVWILESPGQGHSVFLTAPQTTDPFYELNGRLIEQRDEYDNVWKYEYAPFSYPNGVRGQPRLRRILLGGETQATAEAVVNFSWFTGDAQSPATGKLQKVEVTRRYQYGQVGRLQSGVITTHRVEYQYIRQLEAIDDANPSGPQYSHLWANRLDEPVLVTQSLLLNAPALNGGPIVLSSEFVPEYRKQYWHYRYTELDPGSKLQTLEAVFEPAAIERWAVALGCSMEEAVENLLKTDINELCTGTTGSGMPFDYCSKYISYYSAADEQDGYGVNELAGRVKRQFLRSGCACSGGNELTFSQHFRYARRVVPMDEWQIDELVTGYPTRESRLTERTDAVWAGGGSTDIFNPSNWESQKIARSWSEEFVIARGSMVSPARSWISWNSITTPFVIADEIVDCVSNKTARSVHVFETDREAPGAFQRILRFHSDAIESFDTYDGFEFPEGLLQFDSSDTSATAYDAVNWRDDTDGDILSGMVEWWVYDDYSRMTDYGVRKGWPAGDLSGFHKPAAADLPNDAIALKHHTYLPAPNRGPDAGSPSHPLWYSRSDLLASTTEYVNSSETITKSFEYRFHDSEWLQPEDDDGHFLFPRVSLQATHTARESTAQNGPGGTVSSWRVFGADGQVLYDLDEAGTATRYQYEPLTGERTTVTLNDTTLVLSTIPDAQGLGLPAGPDYDPSNSDDSLTSSVRYDLMARPIETVSQAGVSRSFEYRTGQLPPETTRFDDAGTSTSYGWTVPCLMVVEYPHMLADGSFDGPVTIQWADANLNLLRVSTYEPTGVGTFSWDSSGCPDLQHETERSRTVHVYSASGLLEQSIQYPLITSQLLNGQQPNAHAIVTRFTYDHAGRLVTQTSPEGVQSITEYDGLGRPVTKLLARSEPVVAERTVSWLFYDTEFGLDGVDNGDAEGKPSLVVTLVDDPDDNPSNGNEIYRSVRSIYDWRGRARLTFTLDTTAWPTSSNNDIAADGTYQVAVLDQLDRPTNTFAISGGDMTDLIAALQNDDFDADWFQTNGWLARVASHTRQHYSDRGLVYQTWEAVDPTATTQHYLKTNTWYDAAGRPMLSLAPSGPIVRSYYDRLGRVYQTDVRDGSQARSGTASFDDVIDGNGESILEQSVTKFDVRGLPWLVSTSRRRHDATGDGLDTSPVVTHVGTAYDDAARPIGTVDFGVGTDAADCFEAGHQAPGFADVVNAVNAAIGGAYSPLTRITLTGYDLIGRADRVTDPEGVVSMTLFDDMNRTVGAVANAVDFLSGDIHLQWSAPTQRWRPSSEPDAMDQDRLTTVVFDAAGREYLKVAHVGSPDGSSIEWTDQITQFIYDPEERSTLAFGDNLVNHANLPGPLFEIRYPDRATGAPGSYATTSGRNDAVRHGYNLAGEQIATEDQNHTVRHFTRDVAGRLTTDRVDHFGELERRTSTGGNAGSDDVDDWADTIQTEYDAFGRTVSIQTSSSSIVRNTVQYQYDPRGRLVTLTQDVDGNFGLSPKAVGFVYTTSHTTNEDRLESVHYPDGTVVTTDYGSGVDNMIDRVVGLSVGETSLVEYQHLGLGTVVVTELVSPGIQSDRTVDEDGSRRFGTITSGQVGRYPGWDRFGRLRLLSWVDINHDDDPSSAYPTRTPIAQWRFEWSRAGDLLKKQDARPGATWNDRDRLNAYDDLHRLTESRVGGFANFDEELFADTANKSEHWSLDSIGNWTTLQIDSDGDGDFDSSDTQHTRDHNNANEFESDTLGTTTEHRYHDDAGSLGLVKVGTSQRYRYLYDAWNRLVEVQDANDQTIVRYQYNGLHWRTIADHFASGALESRERFLYSPDWQLLEQRTYDASDNPTAIAQQFWGKRGTDDAVARRVDRGDGSGGPPDGDYADTGDGTWYYVTDNLRSVVAVVNAAGKLVERVVYGPFGKSQHHFAGDINGDGAVDFPGDAQTILDLGSRTPVLTIGDAEYQPDADVNYDGQIDFWDIQLVLNDFGKTATGISHSLDAGGPGNPIGYAGYVYVEDFGGIDDSGGPQGHWYARHRFYDPVAGRWLTRDPAGYVDGMSLYLYVHGNPFGLVDPLGLEGWLIAQPFKWAGNQLSGTMVGSALTAAGSAVDTAVDVTAEGPGQTLSLITTGSFVELGQGSEVVGGFLDGAETGAKAAGNAAIDTGASLVTLGQVQAVGVIPVSQADLDNGYGISYGFTRTGTEILMGIGTGGMSQSAGFAGKVGTGLSLLDVGGNALMTGQAGVSIATNGANVQNVTQLSGGVFGLTGTAAGASKGFATADEFAQTGMHTRGANLGARQGREFRTDAMSLNEFDPNAPSHVRGWLANERRRVETGAATDIRNPPGYVQAHGRTTPAREGYDYSNSRLQGEDLNKLEESVRRRPRSCLQ